MHTKNRAIVARSEALTLGPWTLLGRLPGTATPPSFAEGEGRASPAIVPGTVAQALDAAGEWDFDQPTDIDRQEWWYRTTFAGPGVNDDRPCRICFDGLATSTDIWLNGRKLLSTDNMFRAYSIDVDPLLDDDNELLICFHSLTELLKQKRSRPRWKTNLVRNQQLRWHRTSLVGRIPGWAPCAPAVGPWRNVRIETRPVLLDDLRITPKLVGTTGVVTIDTTARGVIAPESAMLVVGEHEAPLTITPKADGWNITGELQIPNVSLWSPHTHGTPNLLTCRLALEVDGETIEHPQTPLGFREVEVRTDQGFAVFVNDSEVFCRGACWTVDDLLSRGGDERALRRDLMLARDAGANMLRVGGTMQYESEAFYRLCDELGLLVWQDFMFANMDYPVDDAGFRENIRAEVTEQLTRLARHPSVVVYCGNSEIEQQAAMLGMPRERWTNDWFARELPELCAKLHPGTTYIPSTPTGGVLPFHTHTGITHYYGVGAYLRPTTDLRRADVKFTPECLGFANLPEPETIYAVTRGSHPVLHDPTWKQRVPRDGGAGWDFEDVRDHYLRATFGVDPAQLRSFDMPRYLELSRAVTGEMMAAAFAEWRSTHSRCGGALTWFYKDLWPGAGWGVVDSTSLPKAAYYYLKRSWQTRQLTLTDEGLNGFDLHLTNETDQPCEGMIEFELLKSPNTMIARACSPVRLAPRSRQRLSGDALFGCFTDSAYAYRFGPPQHDAVVARWLTSDGQVLSEAVHFVRRLASGRASTPAVRASAVRSTACAYQVTINAEVLLDTVRLHADGYLPDDNYFHLAPNRTKVVTFTPRDDVAGAFRPTLEALNLDSELTIPVDADQT